MKNKFFISIIMLFSIILIISCGVSKDNVYIFSPWQLKSDSKIVIKKAKKIKELSIQNYTDTIFPNDILMNLNNLEKLEISSDNSFDKMYQENPKMNIKTVSPDYLTILDERLNSFKSLKILTLEGFTMDHFPLELCALENLEELNIVLGSLNGIPVDLQKFKKLKKLNLSFNDYSLLPDSILLPENLEILILTNNKLSSLPSNLIMNKCLTQIDISNQFLPYYWSSNNKFSTTYKIMIINNIPYDSQLNKIHIEIEDDNEKEIILTNINKKSNLKRIKFHKQKKRLLTTLICNADSVGTWK